MTEETGRNILFGTMVTAILFSVWDEVHNKHRMPPPYRFTSIAVIWTILGIAAPVITFQLAGAYSLGLVLALFYAQVVPQGGTSGETGE